MIKFQNDADTWERLDYSILSRGFLKPYDDDGTLASDAKWLKSEGYKIIEFDCSLWNDELAMHDSLHGKFDFPSYYGSNWDALQECLNEVEIEGSGLVILFRNLDAINIKTAHTLLDIFVSSAQRHLLFSQRLLLLVKVKNKNFKPNPLGATEFRWY